MPRRKSQQADASVKEAKSSAHSSSVRVIVPTRSKRRFVSPVGLSNSTRSASLASETPDTSVNVTPADSMLNGLIRTRASSRKIKNERVGAGSSSHQRLIVEDSEDEVSDLSSALDDEELARRLQLEEYTGEVEESSTTQAKSKQVVKATQKFMQRPARSNRASVASKMDIDEESLDLDNSEDSSQEGTDWQQDVPGRRKAGTRRGKARSYASSAKKRKRVASYGKGRGVIRRYSAPSKVSPDSESDFDTSNTVSSDSSSESDTPIMALPPSKRARMANGQSNPVAIPDDDESDVSILPTHGFRENRRKISRRNKLEKAHPELKHMWETLENIPVITPVQAPQPSSISRSLKPFQLEGLDWMIKQERSEHWKGGLLGDEMGMGKTIQAVSLIMSDYPAKKPSLVLVPPVALMQWQNEINSYTDGKLKVQVIHSQNVKSKSMTAKDMGKFDVLLMSYNSLESMYRKQEKGWVRDDDIIKEKSPIHSIDFHRVILDEAHSIKTRQTGCAKACFALKGQFKWCLSGTPVQNRIGEFFSLLRFLEVRPFADYFCEACPCAELHWQIDADYRCKSATCRHSASEHRSVFNEEILNPITSSSRQEREAALDKLHLITSRIMLRRLKKDHTSSMELPPKLIQVRNEFFSKVERDFSGSIMSNTNREFDTYVSRGVVLNNYANIFGLIMQMRQVANHPDLILRKNAEGGQNVLVCNICDEPAEDAIRSQCKHEFCRSCVKTYVNTCAESGDDIECPRCHITLSIDFEQPEIEQDEDNVKKSSIINRIRMTDWTSSTKIELLIYELYKLRSSKRTLKSIVFSQFTSMLQLVEWRLRRAGFNTVMLDGSMTPIQRQRSIDYFMKNTHVEVFLVSLKAGGVALNLTEASRVFIIDPWWNPAAEWQSADRCHRIGQARPCVITRLVIEDSVESRMVQLQEKKANMIATTVNKDKVAMDKLTPEDLQFLFRGT